MEKIEQLPLERCLQKTTPPQPDEIEISLFGKGIGESILVHFGDGRYAVIDSFINPETNNPIVIDYLQAMGISPDKIELVISTHWHNDHTAGLTKILEKTSTNVKFVTYPMLEKEKFNNFIAFGSKRNIKSTTEFSNILNFILERKLKPVYALHNRLLHNIIGKKMSHGVDVNFFALSPQDKELSDYLLNYLKLPNKNDNSYSFPDDNEISIVIWLQIGDDIILLGGDLEEKSTNATGWKAVIQNHTLNGKANLFKVPHHGSISSHNNNIWSNLLNPNPISILSVFNSSGLPKETDKDRIKKLSSRTFIVGSSAKKVKVKEIKRWTKDFDIKKIKVLPSNIGVVRARKKISTIGNWNIELFGSIESL